jgi:hypothetical protein
VLTFGPPYERKAAFVAHGDGCTGCNPCPHLQAAIREVTDWLQARQLLS